MAEYIEGSFRNIEDRVNFYKNATSIDLGEDLISIFQELVIPYLLEKDMPSLVYILNKSFSLFSPINIWSGRSISNLIENHWNDLNNRGKETLFLSFTSTDRNNKVAMVLLEWALRSYKDFKEPNNINSPLFHKLPQQILESKEYQNFIKTLESNITYDFEDEDSEEVFKAFMYAFLTDNKKMVDNHMLDQLEAAIGWDLYRNRQASPEAFKWLFESVYRNYMSGSHFKRKIQLLLGFNELLSAHKRQNVVNKLNSSHHLYQQNPDNIYKDLWYLKPSCFSPEIMDELAQKDETLRKTFYKHCYRNWQPLTEDQVSILFETDIHSASNLSLFPSPHLPESLNLRAEYEWYDEFYTHGESQNLKKKITSYLSSWYKTSINIDTPWSQVMSILESHIIEIFPIESSNEEETNVSV